MKRVKILLVCCLIISGCGKPQPELVAPAPHLPVPGVVFWDMDIGIVVWDIAPWPRTNTQWNLGSVVRYTAQDGSRKWMAYSPGDGVPVQTGFDSWQEAASWLAAWHYDHEKGLIDESLRNKQH